MKILSTTKSAFLYLFLLVHTSANDPQRGWRAPPVDASPKDERGGGYHRVLVTKRAVDPKLGSELTQLYQDSLLLLASSSNDTARDFSKGIVEYVSVDITFTRILNNTRAKQLLQPVVPVVDFIQCFQYMCSTRIPVRALLAISKMASVQVLQAVHAMTQLGARTTEGDVALLANVARTTFSLNGNGLLIGVLSDSYNCLGGAANDMASGDLPSSSNNIVLVSDFTAAECTLFFGQDEGRAMMQLMYDVAPGARLAFRTARRGQADFAAGIVELAAAGCDIMVDDILFFAEPMFQDGVIAQAVNQVVAQGIPFFSAVGNNGRTSWEATDGFIPVTIGTRVLHQFGTDSSGNPITRMRITMPGDGRRRLLAFQWDEPFRSVTGTVGSQSDIDMYLYKNGTLAAQSTSKNILGGDPYEQIQIYPSGSESVVYELEFLKYSGTRPTFMKLVVFGDVTNFEFPSANPGTNYGHSNAASVAGVGAASYAQTPVFGVAPPEIESFSSAGGVPILFTKNGTRLSTKEIRRQPRFTGPDGGANTFFGRQDSSGTWRFFGTSAAAPHVAAVAALMLQLKGGRKSLTPAQIYSILETTAVDMNDPFTPGFDVGFDFGMGYGLVNALAALQQVVNLQPTPVAAPVVAPSPVAPPVVDCTVTFHLFDSLTDILVATLTNGVTIANPPPCGQANIQAVVPCGDSDGKVILELFLGTRRIRSITESGIPYFLFGNSGSDVKNGKIKAGSYGIRAQVNGVWSPFTNFTLGGNCL